MTIVLDSSAVVAALIDTSPAGTWAEQLLADDDLATPHLMPAEAANTLRRSVLAGLITADAASLAHGDLLEIRVRLYPYRPLAARVWELRANVTTYDAWYVALAETLDASLATLDARLSAVPGPTCEFVLPP